MQKFKDITVEEYLRLESSSNARHEFLDGRMYSMAGATRKHNIIVGNFYTLLHAMLKGSGCRPYVESVRLRIRQANAFYYPDILVSCDSNDLDGLFAEDPVMIAEILSPSTAATEKREKLINYKFIPSLREYLIIHQKKKLVELHRRDATGAWSTAEYSDGEYFSLDSLPNGADSISVDALYEETDIAGSDPEVRESAVPYSYQESSDQGNFRTPFEEELVFSAAELAELDY